MTTAKRRIKGYAVAGLLFVAAECGAASDFFVAPDGGHQAPYASWGAAATNVRDAVVAANAANNGSTVWISNGLYRLPNMITVSNAVVRGFGGDRTAVVIDGGGSVRPFYLNHAGAALRDLTVSNGCVSSAADLSGNGGGVNLNLAGSLLSNCVVVACTATNLGGGVFVTKGTVLGCLLTGNTGQGTANGSAGGLSLGTDSLVANCTISGNRAMAGQYAAGGAYISTRSVFSNCTVKGNMASSAGGVRPYYYATIVNCVIEGNIATNASTSLSIGGGVQTEVPATLRNCLLLNNRAHSAYRGAGGIQGNKYASASGDLLIESCTIVSNSYFKVNNAGVGSGGFFLTGTNYLTGSVIYSNYSAFAETWADIAMNSSDKVNTNFYFNNCVRKATYALPDVQGNITSDPQFVNFALGDFRLAVGSPCINTGTNLTWMAGASDLDGNPRLDRRYRRADMGCYETVFLPSGGTLLSLQ